MTNESETKMLVWSGEPIEIEEARRRQADKDRCNKFALHYILFVGVATAYCWVMLLCGHYSY